MPEDLAAILRAQRTAGNAAVARVVRAAGEGVAEPVERDDAEWEDGGGEPWRDPSGPGEWLHGEEPSTGIPALDRARERQGELDAAAEPTDPAWYDEVPESPAVEGFGQVISADSEAGRLRGDEARDELRTAAFRRPKATALKSMLTQRAEDVAASPGETDPVKLLAARQQRFEEKRRKREDQQAKRREERAKRRDKQEAPLRETRGKWEVDAPFAPVRSQLTALKSRINSEPKHIAQSLAAAVADIDAALSASPPDPVAGEQVLTRVENAHKAAKAADGAYAHVRDKARTYLDKVRGDEDVLKVLPAGDVEKIQGLYDGPPLKGKEEEGARRAINDADARAEAAIKKVRLERESIGQLGRVEGEVAALPKYKLNDDALNKRLKAAQDLRDKGRLEELRQALFRDAPLRAQIDRVKAIDRQWADLSTRTALVGLDPAARDAARKAFDERFDTDDPEREYRKAHNALVPHEIAVLTPDFGAVAGNETQAKNKLDAMLAAKSIRPGIVNDLYKSSWDTGPEDFSIEITVEGVNTIVIHAHCTGRGEHARVKDGANAKHWKWKGQKFEPGTSHPISETVSDAMLDNAVIRKALSTMPIRKP